MKTKRPAARRQLLASGNIWIKKKESGAGWLAPSVAAPRALFIHAQTLIADRAG